MYFPHLEGMNVSQSSLGKFKQAEKSFQINLIFPFSLSQICIEWTISAKAFESSPPLVSSESPSGLSVPMAEACVFKREGVVRIQVF